MILGAAIDTPDPAATARELGWGAVQLHLSDPQTWKGPATEYPGGFEGLGAALADASVQLFVHSPFVLNVASTNNRIRIPSRQLLQKTLDAAAKAGAKGVVVHGGHVLKDEDPEIGFENWFKAVDGLKITTPILIENTAGGAGAMARTLERIAALWEHISRSDNAEHVGFCLDTCHAHAAGLELATIADEIESITGRIDLVHANDSRDPFGSHRDRHANLGQGECDPAGLVEAVVQAGAPAIVETPGGPEAQAKDVEWLEARMSSCPQH